MAFTVEDYQDLVQLLMENPQWQVELRHLLLADDFLALPAIVRDLAESQQRAEARMGRLEQVVLELAEAQKRTEERLNRLEQTVLELAEAQKRTEARIDRLEQAVLELAEAQKRTEQHLDALASRMEELAEAQKRTEMEIRVLTDRLSAVDGRTFELMYRDRAAAYFGGLLRRLRVVEPIALEDALEARLSREEFLDVFRLDLLLNGRLREAPADLTDLEVWLAVEISVSVEEEDVRRAHRRAICLRKAGYRAIPMVAGKRIQIDAEMDARALSVAVLQDGKAYFWEEALDYWARSDRGLGQPA